MRGWLDDNLPDEFRRTAANPDYLPRDAHERAVVVLPQAARAGMVRAALAGPSTKAAASASSNRSSSAKSSPMPARRW